MERMTRFRSTMLLLLFLGLVTFFGFRLYHLQVVETGGNKDNVTTFTEWVRVKASRGDILDCNGNLLVGNRAGYNLVIRKFVILYADDTNEELRRLVNLCDEQGIDYIEHFPVTMERPYTYTLENYSSDWQGYFRSYLAYVGDLDSDIAAPTLMEQLRKIYGMPDSWTDEEVRKVIGLRYELSLRSDLSPLSTYVFVEDATDEELSTILELNVPGVTVEPTTFREYKTPYAAHILGYLGAMDPEQWEYYEPLGYDMDAQVGQDGLERTYELQLHGQDGWRVDEVTKDGTVVSSYYAQTPKAGNNVELTVDLSLQIALEDGLARRIRELKNNPDPTADGVDAIGASGVVMSVKDGSILACASYPTFDPNVLTENYNEILNAEGKPLLNRALRMPYPPGSTYKMVMVIAAIDSGRYSRYSPIICNRVYNKYEGWHATCLGLHGSLDMMEALKYSCNYYFYTLGDNMDTAISDEVAKGLGLGESTGVDMYEETGMRANEQNKWDLYYGADALWYPADRIMAAIGQSLHRYTPLQLCVYASTLANKGVRYKASFLSRVVSADYRTLLEEGKPEILSTMEISDEAYETYVTGMKMVVAEPGGTGYSTLGDYPIPLAAKTGTAEVESPIKTSDHGAIVLFAPADDPEIAIAIYGEQVGHGSSMAQVARAVLDAYFGNEEESDVLTNENRLG